MTFNKFLTVLLFAGIAGEVNAQNLELKDLNIPNAPAFTILDYSPKVIDRPGTAKAFSTNIVSLITQANGLPKNFAFEVSPFWFFKNKLNAYTYMGVDSATKKQSNVFVNVRNASVSIGSVYKDSAKAQPFSANYFAAGARVNIIKINRKGISTALVDAMESLAGAQTAILKKGGADCLAKLPAEATAMDRLRCMEEYFKKDTTLLNRENILTKILAAKPLFQVDLAAAGSWTFKDNSFGNSHHHRTGAWATLELNVPLTNARDINKLINNKNYLSIFGKVRYIQEDSSSNYITFTSHKLLDMGGRLEFLLDRLSISFESIYRRNQTKTSLSTNRNVGILEFKVNDNLFISGTFGKNFGNVNNLFALFGLNWGLGKESIVKPKSDSK